jgi:hypothetical protein
MGTSLLGSAAYCGGRWRMAAFGATAPLARRRRRTARHTPSRPIYSDPEHPGVDANGPRHLIEAVSSGANETDESLLLFIVAPAQALGHAHILTTAGGTASWFSRSAPGGGEG